MLFVVTVAVIGDIDVVVVVLVVDVVPVVVVVVVDLIVVVVNSLSSEAPEGYCEVCVGRCWLVGFVRSFLCQTQLQLKLGFNNYFMCVYLKYFTVSPCYSFHPI